MQIDGYADFTTLRNTLSATDGSLGMYPQKLDSMQKFVDAVEQTRQIQE